jgi:hypothetical protein
MHVCLYNEETKAIAHAREIDDTIMMTEWPLYELEAANRGGAWRPYKGDVPFTFDEP